MNYIYIDLPFINVDLESAATLAFDLSGLVTGTYLTITISRGDVLRFRLRYKDGDHPFWIKTSQGIGKENPVATGISGVGLGALGGLLIWNTTGVGEGTYYYESENHPNMGGLIRVVPTMTGTNAPKSSFGFYYIVGNILINVMYYP